MTEDDLKKFLDENKADIQSHVKKRAIERLLEEHRWTITDQVAKAINDFVAAEVIPEVQRELATQKGAIVSAIVSTLANLSDTLAKELTADAATNVASQYERNKIIKAIWGIH